MLKNKYLEMTILKVNDFGIGHFEPNNFIIETINNST